MKCTFAELEQPDASGRRRVQCTCCKLSLHPTAAPLARIISTCRCGGPDEQPAGRVVLTDTEIDELFPGEDPTLIGNRIAALIAAIGIPTCGGCEVRKDWLNRAHVWLRG